MFMINDFGYVVFRTRYFSESRQGHTPLQGRAYYQMMECLGVSLYMPSTPCLIPL